MENNKAESVDIQQGMVSCDDVLKQYENLRITELTEVTPPRVIVRIAGEIICTACNITTLSGPSKGGKSAITSVVIAGALAEGSYDGFKDVQVERSEGKAVLHFDTEQPAHKHQSNLKTVLRRIGISSTPENFLSYNLRRVDSNLYRKITRDLAQAAHKKFNGLHLVVIDGIADCVKDVNNAESSNEIVKHFEELAEDFATAVIAIIHTNPNAEKERGHLGSQLQRKSESVLTVKTEGDVSIIEPKFLRMAGKGKIPHIQFVYDEAKCYHVYSGEKSKQSFTMVKNAELSKTYDLARYVLPPPSSSRYGDIMVKLRTKLECGETKAKNKFSEMKRNEMVVQGNDDFWRLNMDYIIPQSI